jgi:hypothetical protein
MTGAPFVTENPSLGIATLREKALALIRWHPVQWQAIASNGGALILSRTCPQRHPPSQGRLHSLIFGSSFWLAHPGAGPTVSPPKRQKLVLVKLDGPAHSGAMSEDHQFTIRVEPDTSRPGRFRWALFKAHSAYNRSEMSYATKREAKAEAAKVLDKRIAAWQALR